MREFLKPGLTDPIDQAEYRPMASKPGAKTAPNPTPNPDPSADPDPKSVHASSFKWRPAKRGGKTPVEAHMCGPFFGAVRRASKEAAKSAKIKGLPPPRSPVTPTIYDPPSWDDLRAYRVADNARTVARQTGMPLPKWPASLDTPDARRNVLWGAFRVKVIPDFQTGAYKVAVGDTLSTSDKPDNGDVATGAWAIGKRPKPRDVMVYTIRADVRRSVDCFPAIRADLTADGWSAFLAGSNDTDSED